MNEKLYVQHVSEQGEKFEVAALEVVGHAWCVKSKKEPAFLFLPKSEYQLCDPPEVWVDVTGRLSLSGKQESIFDPDRDGDNKLTIPIVGILGIDGYRLSKVRLYKTFSVPTYPACTPAYQMKDRTEAIGPQWAFVVEKKS